MATDRVNDVRAFQSFLSEKISAGEANFTLDEILGLWEYENSSTEEREATREAISAGLADVEAGRTRPFEEFDREFRQQHSLAPRK
jgi:hypothetical protein